MTPNLGDFLLLHLDRQAVQTRGAITCGGIITLLAECLLIDFSSLQPFNAEVVISYKTLRAVGMLRKRRNDFYVHIPGSGCLFPMPLPANLFSLEGVNLHYVPQTEHQAFAPEHEVETDGEEEVEEEEEQKEEDEPEHDVPPPQLYATYNNIYSLGGSIDTMNDLANSMNATTSALVQNFEEWRLSWSPENYPPPPQ